MEFLHCFDDKAAGAPETHRELDFRLHVSSLSFVYHRTGYASRLLPASRERGFPHLVEV